jgi:hypothetical protein
LHELDGVSDRNDRLGEDAFGVDFELIAVKDRQVVDNEFELVRAS